MSAKEWEPDDILEPGAFYDALASTYDSMTGFKARLERSRSELEAPVRKNGITVAVDMGCGSGVIALALERLNVSSLGIDISPDMIEKAKENASSLNMNSSFVTGDFLYPGIADHGKPDAVFCLGNALPHVYDTVQLVMVFTHWKSCLNPGGRVFLQLLNYQRILTERERIVAVRKSPEGMLLRFYDFTSPRITFNLLEITDTGEGLKHDLRSTLLFPMLRSDITETARRAGFTDISFYSDLSLRPFTEESRDLVATLS